MLYRIKFFLLRCDDLLNSLVLRTWNGLCKLADEIGRAVVLSNDPSWSKAMFLPTCIALIVFTETLEYTLPWLLSGDTYFLADSFYQAVDFYFGSNSPELDTLEADSSEADLSKEGGKEKSSDKPKVSDQAITSLSIIALGAGILYLGFVAGGNL